MACSLLFLLRHHSRQICIFRRARLLGREEHYRAFPVVTSATPTTRGTHQKNTLDEVGEQLAGDSQLRDLLEM